MYALRKWSVRHARTMESLYAGVERVLLAAAPLLERIGHERLEKPIAALERGVKGALFDCQMCGQCALSSTGMSCPMNCPKQIRNGPCGGVRADGYCEVKPEMRCVWVEGWAGAQRMRHGEKIHTVQFAVDNRLKGSSSWLRVVREKRPPAALNANAAAGRATPAAAAPAPGPAAVAPSNVATPAAGETPITTAGSTPTDPKATRKSA